MAIVAPAAAVASATFSVHIGLILGERLPMLAATGVVCGLIAIGLLGYGKGELRSPQQRLACVVLALGAGLGFGIYNSSLALAPHDSGLWPLASSQAASTLLLAILTARTGKPQISGKWLGASITSGTTSILAAFAYLLAVRQGQLALVAVLAALSPGVTAALSFWLLRERLRPWQLLGLGLALVSATLIAAGTHGIH
jgi:drug/metabolite transporter (DMT)-like permease